MKVIESRFSFKTVSVVETVPGIEFHVICWKLGVKEVKLGQVHRIPVATEKGHVQFDLTYLFTSLVHSST